MLEVSESKYSLKVKWLPLAITKCYDVLLYCFCVQKYFSVVLINKCSNWRASNRGNTVENRGCLFVCMFGRTYVILYFDPLVFLCSRGVRPRP